MIPTFVARMSQMARDACAIVVLVHALQGVSHGAGHQRSTCTETEVDSATHRSDMRSLVFHQPGCISLEERPVPTSGYGAAVLRVALTTICGTDLHILKGEYAVKHGLILGHEAVGIIHEVGPGITDYKVESGSKKSV
jgi:hypothetical protein